MYLYYRDGRIFNNIDAYEEILHTDLTYNKHFLAGLSPSSPTCTIVKRTKEISSVNNIYKPNCIQCRLPEAAEINRNLEVAPRKKQKTQNNLPQYNIRYYYIFSAVATDHKATRPANPTLSQPPITLTAEESTHCDDGGQFEHVWTVSQG